MAVPSVVQAAKDRRRLLQRLRRPNVESNRAREATTPSEEHDGPQTDLTDATAESSYVSCRSGCSNLDELQLSFASGRNSVTSSRSASGLQTIFRQSLLPAPLNLDKGIKSIFEDTQGLVPPARVYGGASSKVREPFAVRDVEMGYRFLELLSPETHHRPVSATTSSGTWRNSNNRLSLTPTEIFYSMTLMPEYDSIDYRKAEEVLGLRRDSRPPPVPRKDSSSCRKSTSADSQSHTDLAQHNKLTSRQAIEPLNGRTAWMHALTGLLIVFNTWGLWNAFGLFQAYYNREMLADTSPSAIAWIGSVQLALVFGLGVPVGRLVDRGYFRYVFHGGSALLILGIFCSAFCTRLWQLLLVQGIITGLGMVSS